VVLSNGKKQNITGVFVDTGTTPNGSQWARIPISPTWLGPRCLPGANDTNSTKNACLPWEDHNIAGPCVPCPQTPGSDCSRCDDNPKPSFPPPCKECIGVDASGVWGNTAVVDTLKVPADLPAGDYVLGWRYDCEATAQVWANCADITLVK